MQSSSGKKKKKLVQFKKWGVTKTEVSTEKHLSSE